MNQTQGSMSINRSTWVFNLLKIFYNNDKNIMASKNHRNILNQHEIILLVMCHKIMSVLYILHCVTVLFTLSYQLQINSSHSEAILFNLTQLWLSFTANTSRQLFSQVTYINNSTQNSASAETESLSNINQKLKYKNLSINRIRNLQFHLLRLQ